MCNEAVDSLAHRVTPTSKRSIIPRRLACHCHALRIEHLQIQQPPLNLLRNHVVANALQDLAEDDVR